MSVDWTTRRIGQNTLGRAVCPTLQPAWDLPPECELFTQCDRCADWVCEEHADDNIHVCAGGMFCRDCARGCPEPFCGPED